MPNLDKTGPMGQGPRTGRGWGCCGICRRRRCFGFRRFFSPKKNLTTLEEQEKILTEELNAVREEKASLTKNDK